MRSQARKLTISVSHNLRRDRRFDDARKFEDRAALDFFVHIPGSNLSLHDGGNEPGHQQYVHDRRCGHHSDRLRVFKWSVAGCRPESGECAGLTQFSIRNVYERHYAIRRCRTARRILAARFHNEFELAHVARFDANSVSHRSHSGAARTGGSGSWQRFS